MTTHPVFMDKNREKPIHDAGIMIDFVTGSP
jgi:hypothetical protein